MCTRCLPFGGSLPASLCVVLYLAISFLICNVYILTSVITKEELKKTPSYNQILHYKHNGSTKSTVSITCSESLFTKLRHGECRIRIHSIPFTHWILDNLDNIVDNFFRTHHSAQINYNSDNVVQSKHGLTEVHYRNDYLSDCAYIRKLKHSATYVASGWTKSVYKSGEVALKMIDINGHDMRECLSSGIYASDCYVISSRKLFREIILLLTLNHSHANIIKILGYCIPSEVTLQVTNNHFNIIGDELSVITEYGHTVDVIRLLQMSWEDRFRVNLGLSRLLHHLDAMQIGIADFSKRQFVLVDGEIKLSDLDDLSLSDPVCHGDAVSDACKRSVNSKGDEFISVACVGSRCRGLNTAYNVYEADLNFIHIPLIVPAGIEGMMSHLEGLYRTTNASIPPNTSAIVHQAEYVYDSIRTGKYIHNSQIGLSDTEFLSYPGYELPVDSSTSSYQCRHSVSPSAGCVRSVYNPDEAAAWCLASTQSQPGRRGNTRAAPVTCRAFLLIHEPRTWTGRYMVHFKRKADSKVRSSRNVTLYVHKSLVGTS